MANQLLGPTASVAALRAPLLIRQLTTARHRVKVVATQASLYFFDPAEIGTVAAPGAGRDPSVLILDEDEWPGRAGGQHYQRGDPVLHIELRRWADLLVIAPPHAHTLAHPPTRLPHHSPPPLPPP